MRPHLPLLLAALLILALTPASEAISQPHYLPNPPTSLSPRALALQGDLLWIHDPVRGLLVSLNPETLELHEVPAPGDVREMGVIGGWVVLLTSNPPALQLYSPGQGWRKMELPSVSEDMAVGGGLIWVTLPALGEVEAIDPESLKPSKTLSINIAHGGGVLAAAEDVVWAAVGDGETLLRMRPSTGEQRTLRLGAKVRALEAVEGGALAATSDNEILLVSDSMTVKGRWSLKSPSAYEITLHMLEDGRIIYVSATRWVVGEIEGGEVREVKAEKRITGSALAEDRVWFTQLDGRIGWVWLSRPPKIAGFKVESLGGNAFKAYAEASDPDGDLEALYLTILKLKAAGLVPDNETFPMDRVDGGYEAEFTLERGEALVYVSALDSAGNVGRSSELRVKAQETATTTAPPPTTQETATAQPPPALNLYLLGSSLILLLPIAAAILYLRARRARKPTPRRRRRR